MSLCSNCLALLDCLRWREGIDNQRPHGACEDVVKVRGVESCKC